MIPNELVKGISVFKIKNKFNTVVIFPYGAFGILYCIMLYCIILIQVYCIMLYCISTVL